MREIKRPGQRKKPDSKFFTTFKQKYGEYGTAKAPDAEIRKFLRFLYKDLVYGNLTLQDIEQLNNDPRIIAEACIDLEFRMMKQDVYLRLFACAQRNIDPVVQQQYFGLCQEEETGKMMIYNTIYTGLKNYMATHVYDFIYSISAQFNTPLTSKYRVLV